MNLRRLGIIQKNSRPNHPTTYGKVERFKQTMKRWLRAQPDQPSTIADLQRLLDRFAAIYNRERPHRSLPHGSTPAAAYRLRPKAEPGDRGDDTHFRVRHDRVAVGGNVTLRLNGDLHHIAIGRRHTGTRIIHATTGEILLHLTINRPAATTAPEPPNPNPDRRFGLSTMS